MGFFNDFPIIKYRFGDDDQSKVYFENMSVYVDNIDQIADNATYYTKYTILDGDRPDTLSYKLYGTVDYYWTFFLLNTSLRESGWPLTVHRSYEYIKELYPHWTFTVKKVKVNETLQSQLAGTFPVGQEVTVFNAAGESIHAHIEEKNIDLGQIVLEPELDGITQSEADNFMLSATKLYYSTIDNQGFVLQYTIEGDNIAAKQLQYLAPHHYENTLGEPVDIDPFTRTYKDDEGVSSPIVGLIPITNQQRMLSAIDTTREIKIFNKKIVSKIVSEFNKAVKG